MHAYTHTHRPRVSQVEGLVGELVAVDALEARPVPLDEIPALDHKVLRFRFGRD